MLIQCTKKLQDQLKIKPHEGEGEDPLFSWHANILLIERRKAMVLVNDKNRYTVVLYGLKAKDFAKIEEHIAEAIHTAFQAEGIKEEVIAQYLEKAGAITYTKTKDRSLVARLNKSCEYVQAWGRELDPNVLYQTEVSRQASRLLVGSGGNDYIRPNEELYRDLENMAGEAIFQTEAAVLRVNLELEGHNVWRKLILPLSYTFTQLHRVLQIAFDWKDYHLHEFYIFEEGESDFNGFFTSDSKYRPVLNLVIGEEAFEYPSDVKMKREQGVKLSEYIPAYTYITYNYDFGDDWRHRIIVEKVISDYEDNVPVCLEGEGNAPPEDCGGEPGYDEFLEILADKNHPDYEHTSQWARMQGYRDFDISRVNRVLKYL